MAHIQLASSLPVDPGTAWAAVSDLSRLGDWLSLHEGWRGDLPETLAVGTQVTGVVKVKGMRNRVTWTVDEFDPPHHMVMSGDGVGGTSVALVMDVEAEGDGSTFVFSADFKHPALRGPMGKVAEKAVQGDLKASMDRFRALVS